MLKIVARGGCGLLVITLVSCLASHASERKGSTTEAQVAVLLKWYHAYAEKGKYDQAYRVAELANELAPEDPETVVALKVALRQKNTASSLANSEEKLEAILAKLEQIEKRLKTLEAKKPRRVRTEVPYGEPPGSPDRPD